jgi:hypothetical protein
MSDSAVTSIWLRRAEGPTSECVEATLSTFAEADRQIRKWARSAPKGGGYDKVDFLVKWSNGDSYEGRFDMKRDHTTGGDFLQDQIRQHLRFVTGDYCPPHMTQDQYESIRADIWTAEQVDSARTILRTCALQ